MTKKASEKVFFEAFHSFHSAAVFVALLIRKKFEQKFIYYLYRFFFTAPPERFADWREPDDILSASRLILVASAPKSLSILLLFFAFCPGTGAVFPLLLTFEEVLPEGPRLLSLPEGFT